MREPPVRSMPTSRARTCRGTRAAGTWRVAAGGRGVPDGAGKVRQRPDDPRRPKVMLGLTGRVAAELDEAETAYRLAPLALPTIMFRAMAYSLTGQDEAALREVALGRSLGAPLTRRWVAVHAGHGRAAARPLCGRRRAPRPLPSCGCTRGRCDGDHVDLRGGGESSEETRSSRGAPAS